MREKKIFILLVFFFEVSIFISFHSIAYSFFKKNFGWGGAEEEGEKESKAGFMPSAEPDRGLHHDLS